MIRQTDLPADEAQARARSRAPRHRLGRWRCPWCQMDDYLRMPALQSAVDAKEEGESMIETRNSVIERATITNDDHGLLSAWLTLDFGGMCQGFGGYALYLPKSFRNHRLDGPNYAGHFIWRCMEIAGVSEWSQLKGKTLRARSDHSKVHAIGHIVKDDWFNPREDFQRAQQEVV